MDHCGRLWTIEKAFRISQADLRVRPIYHRMERRIKTHIYIAFCSYKIYKELERNIKLKNLPLSAEQTINELKTIDLFHNSMQKRLKTLQNKREQREIKITNKWHALK